MTTTAHAANQFASYISSVADGTSPAAAWGTSVTPGENDWGAWAQVLSATAKDAYEVEVLINSNAVSGVARDTLVDIGVDLAGGTSYSVLIPTLLASCASSYFTTSHPSGGIVYRFPLHIPAGASVAARARVNNATVGTLRVALRLSCDPTAPELIRVGTFVRAFGAVLASSKGTDITAGLASEGSWTELGTTAEDLWAWEVGMGVNSSAMANALVHADVAVGDDTTKTVAIENAYFVSYNTEALGKPREALARRASTAGDKVFVRLQAGVNAVSNVSAIAYGVGGDHGDSPEQIADVTITSFPSVSTTSTSATFEFTVDPGDAEYRVDDGEEFLPATSPIELADLGVGEHTITVRSTTAPQHQQSFTWEVVEEPAPTADVILTGHPAVSTTSTNATFTFTIDTGSAEYSLDGGDYEAATSPIELADLDLGEHAITIRSVTVPSHLQTFTWTVVEPSSGGGGLEFPALANATTADAIRDRAIAVVQAIVPTYVPTSRFRGYRNEGDGDFIAWAEANPSSAFRRFQVRFDGAVDTPAVSNSDHEERVVRLTTIIAYPHDARTGGKQALDRDTAIDRDRDLLDRAIGLYSRQNFSPPNPDACWFGGDCTRVQGEANDFLVVTGMFSFRRALT